MGRYIEAILMFFRSLRKKPKTSEPKKPQNDDVDEVASAYYRDLLDYESKKKK